ncbi:MAG TPA: serine/threonine-protein kinase, partial [Candidatus Dormibacteraeota bacterium]|nr:serine/threonine-protein kinase [Candidatus Dormibacteraeota bacterium]
LRTARQVSHKNVCRLYDLGEAGDRRFLTMEYVDGEDLSSLLRRIGWLPRDKAIEIARQICAGLQAAHEKGVLHRDLKPANVMIDGRGKARITDFGLAILASDLGRGAAGQAARAAAAGPGTPAYMAPEQLEGRDASARSDIFALGLVLYEMFTGRRAFAAATIPDLLRLHQESTPASPRNIVEGIDPAIERAILRCLEKEPRLRPPSALSVAAALPGGDPLAAALAAGETPSPEMVAAAAVEGSLRPAVASACLLGVLAAAVFLVAASSRLKTLGRAALDKPPDVLVERARGVLARLGHTRPPADSVFALDENLRYLKYIEEHDRSRSRWDDVASIPGAAPFVFWYRQGPAPLLATFPDFTVEMSEPPAAGAGAATVVLDAAGRLLRLEVIPSQDEAPVAAAAGAVAIGTPAIGAADWSALFSEAGLDQAAFIPVPPDRPPPVFCDARASWRGEIRGRPGVPLDVDAGAFGGKPVYFRVAGPWDGPAGDALSPIVTGLGPGFLALVVQIPVLAAGGILARRNLRLGRGDRAGAFRVAVYFLAAHMLVWALWAHHVPTLIDEWNLFIQGVSWTLYNAAIIWVLYIALEPFVRRVSPGSIVSWSRVLTGRPRDPLVGRDILLGCLAGALICTILAL